MLVAGVMTGTSLDGVDCAIVRFSGSVDEDAPDWELVHFYTVDYDQVMLRRLTDAVTGNLSMREAYRLDADLGRFLGETVNACCRESEVSAENLDAIGLHGQTVWHAPELEPTGTSVQIGSSAIVAAITGAKVVSDFRMDDVAAGGEGAPFVPVFDAMYLRSTRHDRIALNIGGMANITKLGKGTEGISDDVLAFDTGPGNVLIDGAMQQLFDRPFDEGGETGARGNVDTDLMNSLLDDAWLLEPPPKSTGRERYGQAEVDEICQAAAEQGVAAEDVVATLTTFTALSIALGVQMVTKPDDEYEVIVAGGGAKNSTLMNVLTEALEPSRIITSDELGIPGDAKEAICFALLAWLRLHNRPGNLPSVTGAEQPVLCGTVRGVGRA